MIDYPYLWAWQEERGETEGGKIRPMCVVAVRGAKDGLTHLAPLAISAMPAKVSAADWSRMRCSDALPELTLSAAAPSP